MKLTLLWILIWAKLSAFAEVSHEVQFTPKELNAASVLVRPEKAKLQFKQDRGMFILPPALQAFGLKPVSFDLNLGLFDRIAKVDFVDLEATGLQILWVKDGFEFHLPIQNQSRAIRSRLGSISFLDASLHARVKVLLNPAHEVILDLVNVQIVGGVSGSGVFRISLVRTLVEQLFENFLKRTVNGWSEKPELREKMLEALVFWAKAQGEVIEGQVTKVESLQIDANGLRYRI